MIMETEKYQTCSKLKEAIGTYRRKIRAGNTPINLMLVK